MEFTDHSLVTILILVARVLLACFCGGAVGFERTKRLKEAGIRTHCIIASAAAIMMIISKYGFSDTMDSLGNTFFGTKGADPSRVASQVVTGISFLGAGVIFRNGSSVKGLTTAAGIWATAAVGMSIGSGMYIIGLLGTLIIVVIQILFHRFSIGNDAYSENEVQLIAKDDPDFQTKFRKNLEEKKIQILSFKVERKSDGTVVYNITVRTRNDFSALDAAALFADNPYVISVSM